VAKGEDTNPIWGARPFFRGELFVLEAGEMLREITLPETNSSHLKMGGWKTSFLLGCPIFRGHVSFREGNVD